MEGLGIDFKLLVVQVVNFLVLLLILKKWVYKPFLKFLDDRAAKIHESLEASERMRKEIKSFEAKKGEELSILREKSQEILNKVRGEANVERKAILDQTAKDARAILEASRSQVELEKRNAIKGVRKEVVSLSLEIARKILVDVNEEKAHELVNEALKEKYEDKG